jgi:hypothetical protein
VTELEMREALDDLLDTCFVKRPLAGGKFQWYFNTGNGAMMEMASKKEEAVARAERVSQEQGS